MPKPSPAKTSRKDSRAVPLKVFGEARKAMRAQWTQAKEREKGARDILTAFLSSHFELLEADALTAMALYGPPSEKEDERTRLERLKTNRFLMDAAGKILAAGKKEKSVRADVEPAMAAVHFLGVVQMAWTYRTMGGCKGSLAQTGLSLFDQLWEGVRT